MLTRSLRSAHLALGNLGIRITPPATSQGRAQRLSRLPLGYLRSKYGPYLVNGGPDATYLMSVGGTYGPFISDILAAQDAPFVLLDIGANVGIFSLVAAEMTNCVEVFAFEPNPEVHSALQANIRLNRAAVTAFPLAISSGTAGGRMLRVPDNHSGGATFRDLNLPDELHQEIRVETVNRVFLNELAPKVDELPQETELRVVCKIDVEGHESEVLDELFASKVGDLIREVVVECDGRFHAEGVAGIEQRLGACGFTLVAKSGSEEHFDAHWVRTA
jgi:FkbM family methyltransferase